MRYIDDRNYRIIHVPIFFFGRLVCAFVRACVRFSFCCTFTKGIELNLILVVFLDLFGYLIAATAELSARVLEYREREEREKRKIKERELVF